MISSLKLSGRRAATLAEDGTLGGTGKGGDCGLSGDPGAVVPG